MLSLRLFISAGLLVINGCLTEVSAGPAEQESEGAGPQKALANHSLSGVWNQEWAVGSDGNQKFEGTITPRWDFAPTPDIDLTMKMRVRVDFIGDLGPTQQSPNNYSQVSSPWFNTEYAELSLRELFIDFSVGDAFWRIGKQQLVWGQADGIKVLDVVNPQTYREFILDDFDDSRIPLWAVSVENQVNDLFSFQFLWIPDTTYDELAEPGTPYFITTPRLVPRPPSGQFELTKADKPDDIFSDSDIGARVSSFLGGWDITLNYLYHYHDSPVFYQEALQEQLYTIVPRYERNNLFGSTVSNAIGDFTLRGELAFNSDTFHVTQDLSRKGISKSPEIGSVVGIDWRASSNTLFSAQWFSSYLLDYEQQIVRDETEHFLSLLIRSEFDNASWELRTLALYSVGDEDAMFQLKLAYWLLGNLQIWVGSDFFEGTRSGLFGQFKDEDRLLLGFEYGF